MGFDLFLNFGDTACTSHHAVIVPDVVYTTSYMNATDTSEGGFKGSYMWSTTLPSVLSTYITPYYGSHVITHRTLITTSINATGISAWGSASGCSNNWGWIDAKVDLMSEVNVYGSTVWSSSGYDIGTKCQQFPGFRLSPYLRTMHRSWFWLSAVGASSYFCHSDSSGDATASYASSVGGVRPYFLIG